MIDDGDFEVLIEFGTEWRQDGGETKLATFPVQTHLARPKEVVTLCGRGRLLFESTDIPFEGEQDSCAVCGAVRDALAAD